MIVTLVTKEQENHYRIPFHYAHGELERVWESDICYATVPPTITEGVKAITLLVDGREKDGFIYTWKPSTAPVLMGLIVLAADVAGMQLAAEQSSLKTQP